MFKLEMGVTRIVGRTAECKVLDRGGRGTRIFLRSKA
jgi:hypothetical protein